MFRDRQRRKPAKELKVDDEYQYNWSEIAAFELQGEGIRTTQNPLEMGNWSDNVLHLTESTRGFVRVSILGVTHGTYGDGPSSTHVTLYVLGIRVYGAKKMKVKGISLKMQFENEGEGEAETPNLPMIIKTYPEKYTGTASVEDVKEKYNISLSVGGIPHFPLTLSAGRGKTIHYKTKSQVTVETASAKSKHHEDPNDKSLLRASIIAPEKEEVPSMNLGLLVRESKKRSVILTASGIIYYRSRLAPLFGGRSESKYPRIVHPDTHRWSDSLPPIPGPDFKKMTPTDWDTLCGLSKTEESSATKKGSDGEEAGGEEVDSVSESGEGNGSEGADETEEEEEPTATATATMEVPATLNRNPWEEIYKIVKPSPGPEAPYTDTLNHVQSLPID
ncbi:hypothetical protein TREMEDRAFT_64377 [Tremella mesenterica DSM 1558]|uniref:uncharacterized protein n=1 Tax=Tremella mesenterica (strain ATCC 24925 / CBS 8224 / DSM 1558 / NBRC 9311 / NRRL Y-6157 / RJB 2259-6 / UBC 559-6) TaxID=578456 RepID=UPI0003F4A350|nr:uncharacterized protein TREMEDRAFT_64377 [Tremella mesenterica DSM 1558]EIW67782.1 hypothetical protein TREMEDRAFT_64377 [Tremella mesenterica DSM 1558]